MDPKNPVKQTEPEVPRFLDFPYLSENEVDATGKKRLNRYSSTITTGHNFPGAQVRSVASSGTQLTDIRPCFMQPGSQIAK